METNHPHNRVVVVGLLDPQRRRNQLISTSTRRTLQGGRLTQFNLQVDSPFGEPFAITVTTGVQTSGIELLETAQTNQPLAVEGVLQTRLNLDPRYALADDDPGRSSRVLTLRATTIRQPHADETPGTTAVWLEGTVGAAPRFGTHRSAAAVELARTILRVRWAKPSGYPGSQAVLMDEADVHISVPLELEHAAYLLVPGNHVQVVGQLDSVLIPIQGRAVTERLDQLATNWRERKHQIEDTATQRRELSMYRRSTQRLSQAVVLSVVVGAITPDAEAQPGDVEAARHTDRQRRATRQTITQAQRLHATLAEMIEADTPSEELPFNGHPQDNDDEERPFVPEQPMAPRPRQRVAPLTPPAPAEEA